MTALLTDNLPLLAGAPNGIKKLRELILELAVRGKLVPQDPSDEPASELLKRIADEKGRWVAEGKIRKQKPLAEVSDDEKPFELPAGWMWTRLGDICLTQTGTTPSKNQSELFGSDVPFIKPGDIYPDQVDYSGEGLSSLGASQSGRVAQAGSLLMVCIGTIGKCNLIERDCSFNQQINSATLYKGLPQYLRIAARSAYFQAKAWSQSSSTTIAILNKGKWEAIPLPLPGLNEQHRIVAKVDELMALCDRLEAQQADAESANAQLVQALLDSLTQASDGNDFAANWQRLAEHFHALLTTEPSIDALKQTLLQLAVMGKLVPQDPSDEPAGELLNKIAAEKARLVKEGRVKKEKPLSEIQEQELNFKAPRGWAWSRIGDLAHFQKGYAFKSEEYLKSGLMITKIQNLNENNNKNSVYMSPERSEEFEKYRIFEGDIVMTTVGSWFSAPASAVGRSFQINQLFDGSLLNQNAVRIRAWSSLTPTYLFTCINSLEFKIYLTKEAQGTANQASITQESIKNFLICVPPENEQHRIVAKVDQLMTLCDQLKTRLIQARQLSEQLASTLVEQAVA